MAEMAPDAFTWMDATAQGELVRSGEVTPSELLEAALARIDALNPRLNAVIFDRRDAARLEAADPDLAAGPFRGVPFLLKDAVAHTAGDPYHCGLQVAKDAGWVEPEDTWLVERFRAAGFVICGKTNLPELASSVTTEPVAYGATHNPWDLDVSPGGSSGGAGAAVASGMVPVAHGNDMGGSIRFPASMCGVVGLKPSRARTTLGPDFGEYWAMTTHEHVLTRTVRDTAGVLDATAGPGVGDPYTAPAPSRPFVDEVGADPGRLRVGFRTKLGGGVEDAHPDCIEAVRVACELLERLGHDVEPSAFEQLDDPRFAEAIPVAFPVFIARELDRWSEKLGREIQPSELEAWNAFEVELGRATSASAYVAALEKAQGYARNLATWWADGHDLLVTPTLGRPPFPLGYLSNDVDPLEGFLRLSGVVSFSMAFNISGQPAISLPLHWNADGLPIGVQLVAAYGREDLLLRVAAQLEQAQPWADRHPPVSAS